MAPSQRLIAPQIRYGTTCYKLWTAVHTYVHRCRTLHGLLHALNNGERCVCAVFLPGGISGNARAAMPRGGDRSQPALSPHNPGPPYPRPACLWAAVFIFCPFLQGGEVRSCAPWLERRHLRACACSREIRENRGVLLRTSPPDFRWLHSKKGRVVSLAFF